MKIIGIHIYGFGRFQDLEIDDFTADFQVIFGQNEAGKSTLMAFIEAVFFGFAAKNRSERSYEPKTGGRYGGRITIDTTQYGVIVIERVKGKAVGDVTVYFEDGTSASESFLEGFLAGMDRSLFRGVFSFGLQDLQGVEQLSSSELGQFLYGVGMTGKNAITEHEKKLIKLQAELFKPQGKKPEINKKLNELSQIEENIIGWKNKIASYNEFHQKKQEIEGSLQQLEQKRKKLNETLKSIEKASVMEPLLTEKKLLTCSYNDIANISFPHQGLRQLERCQLAIETLKENYAEQELKLKQHLHKLESISISSSILQTKEELKQLHKIMSSYQQWKEEEERLKQQIEYMEGELERVYNSLGPDWNHEKLSKIDLNYASKQRIQDYGEQLNDIRQRQQYVKNQLDKKRFTLEEAEQQLKELKQQLISKEEIEVLNQALTAKQQEKDQQHAIDYLNLQLGMVRKEHPFFIAFFFLAILVTSLLVGAMLGHWILAGFFVLLSVAILVVKRMYDRNKETSIQSELERLKNEIKMRNMEMVSQRLTDIQIQLKKDEEIQQQVSYQEYRVSQEERGYLQIVEELEHLERDSERYCKHITEWGQQYDIGLSLLNTKAINEVILLVEQAQEYKRNFSKLIEARKEINEKIERASDRILKLNAIYQIAGPCSMEMYVDKMEGILQGEINKEQQMLHIQEQIEQKREEILLLSEKISYYEDEVLQLFKANTVINETEFRYKARKAEEKEKLLAELDRINNHLAVIAANRQEEQQLITMIEESAVPFDEQIEKLENELNLIRIEEKTQQNELAYVMQEMKLLENGQSYSDLLQKFEIEKQALQQLVKKWALYRASRFLIEKAKEIYENERQPVVMQKAAAFFTELTGGEYVKLFAPVGEETFVVERKDGIRFFPEELSQGTTEQLYLSLRFALAVSFKGRFPFPIVLDDILVNFDDERKKAAASMIQTLSENRQVLLFTCHSYIAELFPAERRKELSEPMRNRL